MQQQHADVFTSLFHQQQQEVIHPSLTNNNYYNPTVSLVVRVTFGTLSFSLSLLLRLS
jgi:hypothetical protein